MLCIYICYVHMLCMYICYVYIYMLCMYVYIYIYTCCVYVYVYSICCPPLLSFLAPPKGKYGFHQNMSDLAGTSKSERVLRRHVGVPEGTYESMVLSRCMYQRSSFIDKNLMMKPGTLGTNRRLGSNQIPDCRTPTYLRTPPSPQSGVYLGVRFSTMVMSPQVGGIPRYHPIPLL